MLRGLASATFCFAVGSFPGETIETLTERWDGTAWKIVPSPSRRPSPQTHVTSADPSSAPRNTLLGVSCPSATSCVAVGDSRNDAVDHTLVKRLTGNKWSVEPSPDPAGAIQAALHGVACTSPAACVAVGDSTAPQTLVEQYG